MCVPGHEEKCNGLAYYYLNSFGAIWHRGIRYQAYYLLARPIHCCFGYLLMIVDSRESILYSKPYPLNYLAKTGEY